ncbi:unnamed protein product [Ilex paraguariensis]|uniref:Signal peptidase complex-like protein DTM1 n=1 Tax=Ilex paraguariensis TaxID=185542 RepID=A0ABC8UZA7_9AQUA
MAMGHDAVFRLSLVWLAAVVVLVGLYTQSFKKMVATYLFGMFAICGVLLPDWEFFDRGVSQWCSPLQVEKMGSQSRSALRPTTPTRFRIYPIRMAVYTVVYGIALHKWWMFISN